MKAAAARRLISFSLSVYLHTAVLVFLVFSPGLDPPAPARPIYEQAIKPHESHLVWYNLSNRLPEVKPSATESPSPPPRTRKKFSQEIVAGQRDDLGPPQMIHVPAPEVKLPKPLALPNVLAGSVMPARPVRAFTPPPEQAARRAAALPDAPRVDSRPDVHDLAMNLAVPKAPALPFRPPPVRSAIATLPVLPAAPALAAAAPGATDLPRISRNFVPPPSREAAPTAPVDLSADAPAPAIVAPTQADLAIAGLNPVDAAVIPPLPGSHAAGFSAGISPRTTGAETRPSDALLVVPGLLAHDGVQDARAALVASLAPSTSPRSLMEAARLARQDPPNTNPPDAAATRVANVPDPRLQGRAVYTVAIQMPNVTSYSGSWLVWFAERRPIPGVPLEMNSPIPVRKVDPKYIQAAAEERIEGSVRLFAVIRTGGQVDSVELLRHLDTRLDQSAEEALRKWVFQPARRDGTPVDVDAVFDIPFHLAPKLAR